VLAETVVATQGNDAMTVALALSYGGRQDVINATRKIARAAAAGELDPDDIDEGVIARALTTAGMPDPDLRIPPSGELRVSNFFLFQGASPELSFPAAVGRASRDRDLRSVLPPYQLRARRFGTLSPG